MYAKKCRISILCGLHARIGVLISDEAVKYQDHEKVFIRNVYGDHKTTEVGSVMGLLLLAATNYTILEVFSEDDTAAVTVDKIAAFIDGLRE
jgi:phosphotransferase system HPr (HPr) family protein